MVLSGLIKCDPDHSLKAHYKHRIIRYQAFHSGSQSLKSITIPAIPKHNMPEAFIYSKYRHFHPYVKDHVQSHADSDRWICRSADGHALEGLPVSLVKGSFLRTRLGFCSARLLWGSVLGLGSWVPSAPFSISDNFASLCASPISQYFFPGSCIHLQPHLPGAGIPRPPGCTSGSHTRQVAAGLVPWEASGVCRADHCSRGEGCQPRQGPQQHTWEACGV